MRLNSAKTAHGYDSFRQGDKKWSLSSGRQSAFTMPSARCYPCCREAQLHIQQTLQLRESSEQWLSSCLPSLSWIKATTLLWWWAWICFDSSLLLLACLETYWPFPIELKVSQLSWRAGKQEEEIFNREPCQSCAGSSSEHWRTWQEKSHRAGSGLFIFC